MRKHVLALLAATALAGTAAPALAQSVNERQANIEQRINVAARNGAITATEAARLRAELREIANIEQRYRRDGLSAAERIDLDRRFDALNRQIRNERTDNDDRAGGGGSFAGAWEPLRQREVDFNQRVEDGIRRGNLNRAEADRLRRDYTAFVNLATQYRRSGNGYDARERSELQRRYDFLISQIRYDQADYEPISRRLPALEQRIEIGIRNGQLTRNEANQLRQDLRELERLEDSYRRSDGRLETREKADLDRRFAVIRTRIFNERTDNDHRPGRDDNWPPLSNRTENLERRIDAGVRNGSISQSEAYRLRAEWRDLVQLETHYRRDGLSLNERSELQRRFEALAARIRWERNDWDNAYRQGADNDWWTLSDRSQNLERRIEAGVRNGSLTQAEAVRLRSEWRYLVQLEANYRRDGLSANERAELQRRFEILAAKIRWERNDWQNRR